MEHSRALKTNWVSSLNFSYIGRIGLIVPTDYKLYDVSLSSSCIDIELDSVLCNFNKLGAFAVCPCYLDTRACLFFEGILLLLFVVAGCLGVKASALLKVGFVGSRSVLWEFSRPVSRPRTVWVW